MALQPKQRLLRQVLSNKLKPRLLHKSKLSNLHLRHLQKRSQLKPQRKPLRRKSLSKRRQLLRKLLRSKSQPPRLQQRPLLLMELPLKLMKVQD